MKICSHCGDLRATSLVAVSTFATLFLLTTPAAWADGVTFQELATDPASGLAYERVPSESESAFDRFIQAGEFYLFDIPETPLKSRGAPGAALFDYDGDGDLDIYVTNGPGRANSLFANQLRETGTLTFVDVALAAGVDATDQDSSGVCFGDTDNDG
ncbi:MAG: VCBS repeat-containing protein, partial [Holophagales bacterium]|nr:VCBS repeat-containing protein [Holophagales bacterium]